MLYVIFAYYLVLLDEGLWCNEYEINDGFMDLQHTTGAVLTEILLNSTQLFRIDIPGILVLVPRFLDALDAVLREPKPRFR